MIPLSIEDCSLRAKLRILLDQQRYKRSIFALPSVYIYPPRGNELFDPRYTHKLFPLSQGVPPLNEENKYVAKCGGYDEHRVEHGTIGAAGMATIARRRHRNDSARRERKI